VNLQQLIRVNRADRSFADLENESDLSRQRWQQLEAGNFKGFPEPDTIREIATVLRLSIASVIHAAAETLNLPMPDRSGRLDQLPDGIDDLPVPEWEALRTIVSTMIHQAQVPQPGQLRAARRISEAAKNQRAQRDQHAE
jgi:transcriptional regulator with XRE-family HTH domain